ncbi:nucleoporin p54 [Periplaneta americana]|uniref:nucleoporin p54 n=1 Tax=Periplaneta americana TaxID=6978 RepID=UPI0037E75C7E
MAFNLGSTSGFPSATSSAAPTFGFGNTATTTKSGFGNTGFSFGGAASTAPSFSLGGTTSTTSSGFGFGGLSSSIAPGGTSGGFGTFGTGFGTNPSTTTTTTTANPFGGFGGFGATGTVPTTTQSSFQLAPVSATRPLFGQPQTTTSNLGFGGFGTFGVKPQTTPMLGGGFGGFGTGSTGTFGQAFAQPQQQVQPNPLEALYNAVFNCNVYGDERDSTLARWNLLQALWGIGKAYYSQTAPPVELTQQNPLCRFKAIGYSCMPSSDNAQGLVTITFNKKEEEVRSQQAQLVTSMNIVLGSKPNLTLTIEGIKPISETKTQVAIYVEEKSVTGSMRRIPGTDLSAYLMMQKQQLSTLGADNVFPQVTPDKDQIKEYLENPPAGIDPRLWKQAQLDNPNPENYIPVPMIGFGEVRWRMKCQEQETKLHQAFLDRVAEDIAELQKQHTATVAKVAEYRRKFLELEHRVLQVLVKQEVSRKVGLALQPEEEALRSQLEALHNQLNAPAQFKGQVSELLSQMRMQRQEAAHREVERYSMDPAIQDDIKQFLVMEQNGMAHLIETIQRDMSNLKIIKEGMTRLLQGH